MAGASGLCEFKNLNHLKKNVEVTIQLYISGNYHDSPRPHLQNKMSELPALKYKVFPCPKM